MTAPPTTTATASAGTERTDPPNVAGRDPWFDNAKMTLVTLVVCGHSLVMLMKLSFPGHLYDFLYSWHMPTFVLITGYLSRNFRYSRKRLWSLVRGVAVPYVIMEAALAVFRELAGGERFQSLWTAPHWPLWYLPALFCWRLATPPLRRLGLAAIPVALATSLLGGYVDIDYLDLRRVLGFLPFYAIGLCLTRERLEILRTVPARVVAVAGLVGLWVLSGYTDQLAQTRWYYYSAAYAGLHASDYPAMAIRAVVLLMGVVGAFAALTLIPRRRGWFTRMGAASLIVYLCHGFFVKAAEYSPYDVWAVHHEAVALPLTMVCAVAVAMLLASPAVSRRLERAVDPLTYAESEFDRAVNLHAVAADLERDRDHRWDLVGATS